MMNEEFISKEPSGNKWILAVDTTCLQRLDGHCMMWIDSLRADLDSKLASNLSDQGIGWDIKSKKWIIQPCSELFQNCKQFQTKHFPVPHVKGFFERIKDIADCERYNNFELLIVSDGHHPTSWDLLRQSLSRSKIINRITILRLFFVGNTVVVERALKGYKEAFTGIQTVYTINDVYENQLIRIKWNYTDDLQTTLNNLRDQLKEKHFTSLQVKTAVRETVDKIFEHYLNELVRKIKAQSTELSGNSKGLADVIHQLFNENKLDEVMEFCSMLLQAQKEGKTFKKIRKVFKNIEKCGIQYYHFSHHTVTCVDMLTLLHYVYGIETETCEYDDDETSSIKETTNSFENKIQSTPQEPAVDGGMQVFKMLTSGTSLGSEESNKENDTHENDCTMECCFEDKKDDNIETSNVVGGEATGSKAEDLKEETSGTSNITIHKVNRRKARRYRRRKLKDAKRKARLEGKILVRQKAEQVAENVVDDDDDMHVEEFENQEESSNVFDKDECWQISAESSSDTVDMDRVCAISRIESKIHVLQIQKQIQTVPRPHTMLWLGVIYSQKCPLRILGLMDQIELENKILADHISAEAYIHIIANVVEYITEKRFTFQSTCSTEAFPIFLYNFENPNNKDLFEDKESQLYSNKTQMDDVIVDSVCNMIAVNLMKFPTLDGNKALYAISCLYLIYKTKRIQNNTFLMNCLRNTILRISIVFECDLLLVQGGTTSIYVRIIDAFRYAVETLRLNKGNCLFCNLGEERNIFKEMLQVIFNMQLPSANTCHNTCYVRDAWCYLKDMCKCRTAKRVVESIVKTKIQDWIDTQYGPILLGCKTNENIYSIALRDVNIGTLLNMVEYLKHHNQSKRLNHVALNQFVTSMHEIYTETFECNLDFVINTEVCASTCRPLTICPRTGNNWRSFVPKELLKSEYSFFNICGKYFRKYKTYPEVYDVLDYVVKLFPNKVFYSNIEEVLEIVIDKFIDLDLDIDVFNENFKKSWIVSERMKIESACGCIAHRK